MHIVVNRWKLSGLTDEGLNGDTILSSVLICTVGHNISVLSQPYIIIITSLYIALKEGRWFA